MAWYMDRMGPSIVGLAVQESAEAGIGTDIRNCPDTVGTRNGKRKIEVLGTDIDDIPLANHPNLDDDATHLHEQTLTMAHNIS